MNKLLSYLLLGTFFVSCSSMKKGSYDDLDKEFDGISNEDFKEIRPLRYKSNDDNFKGEESSFDALSTESISRLPESKLDNFEEEKDPIAAIVSHCYLKEFSKAEKIMDKAYDKYKLFPSYWNQVGTCYYLQNDRRKAFLYYNKARDLGKKYSPAYNNLGVIYLGEGKDQKALLAFQKAYDIGSFSLTPVFNLGQLYLKYGFVSKAKPLFLSLYKKNKTDKDVLHALATCFLLENNPKQALALIENIDSDYYEDHPEVALNFASSLKMAGQDSRALSIFSDIKVEGKETRLKEYYEKVSTYIGAKK